MKRLLQVVLILLGITILVIVFSGSANAQIYYSAPSYLPPYGVVLRPPYYGYQPYYVPYSYYSYPRFQVVVPRYTQPAHRQYYIRPNWY